LCHPLEHGISIANIAPTNSTMRTLKYDVRSPRVTPIQVTFNSIYKRRLSFWLVAVFFAAL
jgi:hypothetical protein